MKFLVAIVLLALAVAQAHHVPEHTLRGSRFREGYTYVYDMALNVTAGVLGMSSQVSASVLRADVTIRVISGNDHVLKVSNVRVSGSVAAIDNKFGDIKLRTDSGLEDRLSAPIKFVLEDGKVTSYTLSRKDNLESKKIKKSILRSLEMHVPEYILVEMETPDKAGQPFMYNVTENTDYGVRISNYIITSSPDVEFPSETIVYNISRFDNYEGEWYPGYKLHHNFQRQGCPEVCRQSGEWKDNQYGAGCPSGFEPHHSPIKRSFTHQQSLGPVKDTLSPEVITTVENHYAKLYDQDMEVLVRYQLRKTSSLKEEADSDLNVEAGQETYTDLHEKDGEITEEIDEMCHYKQSGKAVQSAKELLKEIADLIIENNPSSPIGEKIILFRDVLSTFTVTNFDEMLGDGGIIATTSQLQHRPDDKSIERQVWLDILPLVGTQESVKFIVKYIREELQKGDDNMLIWEAKEMLESLPQNLERPDEDTIIEIEKLMKDETLLKRNTLLHSAVHLCMGRVIGEICGNVPLLRNKQVEKQGFQTEFLKDRGLPICPEAKVNNVIKDISQKLKNTRRPEELAIYVAALTYTGMREAIYEVKDYAHGTAENMQDFSPRRMSFTRSVVLHALHNIVGRYPEDVLEIVLPIFFNETETPKVRNAAFGVLIKCQPSLAVLERVAVHSWFEKSREVGSFVSSTLETFGNSSQPCMQLLSHRIRKVLPQVKRFNIGFHHAKNHMWTYFDALRLFGLEGRLEYTPNNESFIPSTLYHSISYTMDSLRDSIYQNSLNIEGLTQEKILEQLYKYLDVQNIEPISGESEIFGKGRAGMTFLKTRIVENLRFVTFQKLFYKTSYYYLDAEQISSVMQEVAKVFVKYLRKTESRYSGYLVKVFLPSSYHTVAMAKTLPYPVEFQMRQPVVFSLGIKTDESMRERPRIKDFDLHLKPSMYLAKVFTNQMKNLRDCKEVGVYHTHKIGLTYPFQIKYDGYGFPNIIFKYKVPVMKNGNILYYYTEAGTYAGKKELKSLPMDNGIKAPIRTQPTPFKFEREVTLVGVPPFKIQVFSEDINLFRQRMPKTPTEALHMAVRNILNAGWRYKSANITFVKDITRWTGDTETTFKIEYSHKHIQKVSRSMSPQDFEEKQNSAWNVHSRNSLWQENFRQSESAWCGNVRQSENEDWSTEFPELWQGGAEKDDDWYQYMTSQEDETLEVFSENAERVSHILKRKLHIRHSLNISISAQSLFSTAYMVMDYSHTYDKTLHLAHIKALAKRATDSRPYEANLYHILGYRHRPDELYYDRDFGNQLAYYRTAINWPKPSDEVFCGFKYAEIAVHGFLGYKSNKEVLQKELWQKVYDDKYFLPETREKCLEDVRDKNPLSTDCIKAIREHSAFNRMTMYILWIQNVPRSIKQIARIADAYIKHYFFEHMHLKVEDNNSERIAIEMKYIDKFVDEPVADWKITTPTETVTLKKIPVGKAEPFSSVYSMNEAWLLSMTNNTYPARCVLSENYVQTYDLVSYPFEAKKDCHYVLSTHCTRMKHFAILLHGKDIHIHVASTKLILLSKPEDSSDFIIRYGNKDVTVKDTYMFNEENEIYAYIEYYKSDKHLRVIAKKAGISVLYDGKNVKIQVSPRYKGELCGLCSEFDGEELREFRGMDRCLYTDPVDFAESNLIKRSGRCQVTFLRGKQVCEGEDNPAKKNFFYIGGGGGGEELRHQRNVVIYRGEEVCFSDRPVSSCPPDVEPSITESQQIGFYCLPKDDLTAKNMSDEAEWLRSLDELRTKSVNVVETVEVPKWC